MFLNYIKSAKFILLVVVFFSCTAPIDLKVKELDPVIVVYGFLTDETTHQTIRITRSSPYFEASPNEPISNALVEVRSGNGEVFQFKETDNKGYYQSVDPIAATPGQSYSLLIQVDFDNDGVIDSYDANTTMLPPFTPDSISVSEINIMGQKHYKLDLYGQDSPGKDFYLSRFIRNDTLVEYKISQFMTFSDEGVDGQYVDGRTLMFFDDKNNNGVDEKDSLTYLEPGDKVTLCISRIEKGYFNFINQSQKEKEGENPFFGGPASNITTNLSNNAVGYFTAFSTSRLSTYVPKGD